MKTPIKKFTQILFILSIPTASLLAASSNDDVLKRLENLENEIASLKSKNIQLQEKLNKNTSESMEEELGTLEDRLDEVETMVLTDKIDFGLGFRNRVENYEQKLSDGTKISDKYNFSSKLWLNMNADITENMSFHGRATMYKYWSDSDVAFENSNSILASMGGQTQQAPSKYDYKQGRMPGDTALYIDRAYIDWTVYDGEIPVILTIGRQPATDGPSYEFKENTVRKATYSALFLDAPQDGIVMTAKLDKLLGESLDSFRFGYGKAFQAHDASYVGSEFSTISGDALQDTHMMGLFLEGKIPSVPNSFWMLSYIGGGDMPANPTASVGNENIGDMAVYGVSLQFSNLLSSGVDLFAHYGISNLTPNGKTIDMGFGPMGLMTNEIGDTDDKNGYAYWVGGRYNPYFLPDLKIGYEYNHGSKNWFSFLFGSNDIVNKLATRGDAHEIYVVYDINRYAYIQAGALMVDYDYTGSGVHVGAPMSVSNSPRAIDTLANYYLQFSLLY